MAASAALTAPRPATARRTTRTSLLRRWGIAAVLAVVLALCFQLLAAVGMHLVLSRPALEMPAQPIAGVVDAP